MGRSSRHGAAAERTGRTESGQATTMCGPEGIVGYGQEAALEGGLAGWHNVQRCAVRVRQEKVQGVGVGTAAMYRSCGYHGRQGMSMSNPTRSVEVCL